MTPPTAHPGKQLLVMQQLVLRHVQVPQQGLEGLVGGCDDRRLVVRLVELIQQVGGLRQRASACKEERSKWPARKD